MSENPDYLLVYGTLRPGFENEFARYLRQRGQYVGEGTFSGQLFDIGAYPGALCAPTSETTVWGTVYDISAHKVSTLAYLDHYEGVGNDFEQPTEYVRTTVPICLNEKTITCWIYLYNLSINNAVLIKSGDYVEYRRSGGFLRHT